MKTTHNPYVYNCGTCGHPVSYSGTKQIWAHLARNSSCVLESVIEIALSALVTKHS